MVLGSRASRRGIATAAVIVMATAALVGGTATVATAGTVAKSSAGHAAVSVCTGTIQIDSLAFTGSTPVNSGDIAGIAQNCTNQAQSTTVTWVGRFTGPGTGIPAGCLAIDPFVQPANFAPLGQVTTSTAYRIFAGCTATGLQVTATIVAATGGTVLAQQTANLVIPQGSTCTGTIQINSLAFGTVTQLPGGLNAALTLVAQNCTNQAQSAKVTFGGRFISSGTGIPPGCAAIDPFVVAANFAATGQFTFSTGYFISNTCTATDLQVTATISAVTGGIIFATQTADFVIRPPSGACTVSYVRQSEWGGGFVASMTVTNTSALPVANWSLAFTFPGDQRVTNAWNAMVTQTGQAVSARGTGSGTPTTLNAGSSASFGFQGTWQTSDASPTAFTLNGSSCTTELMP
jgi:hypothetical protein